MEPHLPPTLTLVQLLRRATFGCVSLVTKRPNPLVFILRDIYPQSLTAEELKLVYKLPELLERLKHHNILQYYQFQLHAFPNHLYVYTEYCDLGSLAKDLEDRLAIKDYLNEPVVWERIAQLAEVFCHCIDTIGREELYPQFFAYRFFNPRNIFLHRDGTIRVGDFGLYKPVTKDSPPHLVTPEDVNYVAPEVFRGGKAIPASAMFSFGCVVYSMCTLEVPPLYRITEVEVVPPRQSPSLVIPPQYSLTLRNLMHSMLRYNSVDRLTFHKLLRMQIVREAIYRVQKMRGVEAPTTGSFELPALPKPVTIAPPTPCFKMPETCLTRSHGVPRSIYRRFNSSNTVLHLAANTRDADLLVRHLDYAGKWDDDGKTALMICVEHHFIEGVNILIPYEAKKQMKGKYNCQNVHVQAPTALIIAATIGDRDIVALLYPEEKDVPQPQGLTPLMCAALNNHISIVKQLAAKQHGLQTVEGKTALMLAAMHGCRESVEALCAWEIGKQDAQGKTALIIATAKGHLSCVKLLRGMEEDICTPAGLRAIDFADRKRQPEVYTELTQGNK